MNQVIVTSPVSLHDSELADIKTALHLTATDTLEVVVDKNVIAGLSVSVNGVVVDLTVKRQLAEIARES